MPIANVGSDRVHAICLFWDNFSDQYPIVQGTMGCVCIYPIGSMERLYFHLHENHTNQPNVGEYTIQLGKLV